MGRRLRGWRAYCTGRRTWPDLQHPRQKLGVAVSVPVTRVWLIGPVVCLKWWGSGLMTIPVSESKMKRKLCEEVIEEDIPMQTSALLMHPCSQACVCCAHIQSHSTQTHMHTHKMKEVLEPTCVSHSTALSGMPTYSPHMMCLQCVRTFKKDLILTAVASY